MEIRLIKENEIDSVMVIINDAKKYLSFQSKQWQQGYPYKETMLKDIKNNVLYGIYENNILVCLAALVIGKEPTYVNMIEGSWKISANEKDLIIHRIAIKDEYRKKGYATKLMQFALKLAKENNCVSIKADTHKVNIDMQNLLTRNNYELRGIIDLARGEEDELRLAYELVI